MGLISWLFGGGVTAVTTGVREVAEVLVPNAEKEAARTHAALAGALDQFGREFRQGTGRFDQVVDGLNRLPRPALALSCLALFGYAMADPVGFSVRMQGLALVPEPLWWLLGAIVSFYFGARELHHFRERRLAAPSMEEVAGTVTRVREIGRLRPTPAEAAAAPTPASAPAPAAPESAAPAPEPAPAQAARAPAPEDNPAIRAWRERPR